MYIPGRNPTIEALRSPIPVNEVLLQQDINQDDKITEILSLAAKRNIKVTSTSRKRLEKLSNKEPHQGVIANVALTAQRLDSDYLVQHPGLYVYIREALYEHNLGAVIRTAEVAGCQGVIITPKSKLTPVVARVSMGAVFHIPVFQESLFPTIKQFHKAGLEVAGLDMQGDSTLFTCDLRKTGLLIVGGEDRAISEPIRQKCDQVISIPQFGNVSSLNMSVAASLAIYEYVRQSPKN